MNRQSYRFQIAKWQPGADNDDSGKLRSLREMVFVAEKGGPPGLVADALDAAPDTVHVLALDENGGPVGAGRIHRDIDVAWIARMAVLADWRDQGVGHALLSLLLSTAKRWNVGEIHLHAPIDARRFYERHGFRAVGDDFPQAGGRYVEMRMKSE